MKPQFELLTKIFFCSLMLTISISAQTTAFTYQGNLQFSGQPANGNFDFEFALFDAAAAGSQLGATQTVNSVAVSNGAFSVSIDFGSQFPGANRFLEIRVRPAGQPGITILSPRQPISSAPYAVKSLAAETAQMAANATNAVNATNATNAVNATTAATATNALSLGGVAANQYVLTGDARLSDARPPTAGSANYIQNRVNQQALSNFNISGNGTAAGTLSGNIVNATTQININGVRALLSNDFNTVAGFESGASISTGNANSFFGRRSGFVSTGGSANSYFGYEAGRNSTLASSNSFFGRAAGFDTTTGSANSFFGIFSGGGHTMGDYNTFVGTLSKFSTASSSGDYITLLGAQTEVNSGLASATAIGARATVTQSNSLVLGSIAGINGETVNTNVGIGTTAPSALLDIATNGGNIRFGSAGCTANTTVAIGLNGPFGNCINYTLRGTDNDVYINRPIGGAVNFREGNNSTQVVINAGGTLDVRVLGTTGGTALCRNADQEIAFCSSSLRYKKNIAPFAPGLSFVRQLRPIAYEWKTDGNKDVGFGAEDVAKIDPRFVTYNDKGEVEGIKYDRLSVAFVNAFREQQAEIEDLRTSVKAQNVKIDQLVRILCELKPESKACGKN